MRIVWKDTVLERKNMPYRGYSIEAYNNDGWTSGMPGDNNIYKTSRCAKNAIDEVLGLDGLRDGRALKRHAYGYEIIGHKDKIS